MAEDNPYNAAAPLAAQMRARLLSPDTLAFGLGSISNPEQSLLLFKRNCAPRDFVGFVDTVSMAPTSSLQNRGVKVFNGVVSSPVGPQSAFLLGKMEEQLKHLSDPKHGPLAQQLLLTESLPQDEYDLNIGNIAECLSADSRAVRRDAASRLERLIIVTNHKGIKAFKAQLLVVARKTYDVICDNTSEAPMEDEEHLRACGHLHLLAASAVLCRTSNNPSGNDFSSFMNPQKPNKKLTGYYVKKEIFKVFQVFYEHLERFLKERSKTAAPATIDLKKFIRAEFCDQMSSLFLILNQIAEEGEWSDKTLKLLADLKDICDVIAREGKRLKPEAKTGIDALLVRSLVILLNSTFAKVRQAVGESSLKHQVKVAELLTSVTQTVQPSQMKNLMPLISTVAFHESPEVCHIITELLNNLHQPAVHAALDYLEASLGVADFTIDRPERPEEVCKGYRLKGHFGQQIADCEVLVHAGQFKAKTTSSSKCMDQSQDGEEVGRQRRNIEMLAKLSSSIQAMEVMRKGGARKFPLVQLMAFQNSPFVFYALESLQGQRLLEHVINHRAAHRWLSTAVLTRVMYYVISALKFLASQHIASREITAYYMLVGGRSRRGGVAGEKMDVLTTDDFTVKLTNLGLSHQYREETDEKDSVRPVETQGPIPLLWTAPEALLKGEYSEMSMVYSAGCVMYELWTHGCQPFATYQKSAADTVRMMLLKPDSTPLIKWPCIPEDVYSIMRECTATEPFSRPSLASLKQTFRDVHTRKSRLGPVEAFNDEGREQDYPSFSDDQVKRKHLPELGIPPDIQQVIEDHQRNNDATYRNMAPSRWDDYADHTPEMADQEFKSPYWIEFAYMEEFTSVREKLPPSFVQKELLLLEEQSAQARDQLRGVTDWLQDEEHQPVLEQESQDHIVHERRYNPAWTMLDAAYRGLLTVTPEGYYCMQMERVVHVLLSLARAVHALHSANWLHRDIRAANVLVDCQTGEVTLARVGRMCQVRSPTDCIVEKPFEDSWRWLGPEVLSDGKYTRENDVFMFGTLVWETFWSREVAENNPTATEMNYLPFADQPKDNILTLVRQKTALEKPEACPDWLYQMIINCRDPDPAMRPLIADIMLTLEREYTQKPDPTEQFLHHPKLMVAAHEQYASAAGAGVPELPARFHTKHTRPFSVVTNTTSTNGANQKTTAGQRRPATQWSPKLEGAGAIPTPYDLVTKAAQDQEYLEPVAARTQDIRRRATESDKHRLPNTEFPVKEVQLPVGSRQDPANRMPMPTPRTKVYKKIRNTFAGRALPPVPAEKAGDDGDGGGSSGGDQGTCHDHLYEEVH